MQRIIAGQNAEELPGKADLIPLFVIRWQVGTVCSLCLEYGLKYASAKRALPRTNAVTGKANTLPQE